MEAYEVWATLNLKGDALKKMEQFTTLTKKASIEVTKFLTILEKFNRNFTGLSDILKVVNPEFSKLNKDILSSAKAMDRASESASKFASTLNKVRKESNGGRGGLGGAIGGFALGATGLVGGAIGAGILAGGLVTSSYHTGMDFQKEMGLLTAQNIPGLNQGSINNFLKNTNIPGVSKLDLLKSLNDAAVITKGSTEAFGVAPVLAKMGYLGAISQNESFKLSPQQLQAAIKTAEIVSGSRDPAVLNKHLDMMMRTWISTGGRVQPSQYQSIVRSMRGYARGMDPDFFYYMLEPFIQEFGTRSGPMVAQFYSHLKAGRLTTQAAQLLAKGGLVDPKQTRYDKVGRVIGINPGGIVDTQLMDQNIFQWIDKYLPSFFKKMGASTSDQQQALLGRIFTNTDLALVSTYLQQENKFKVSAAANRRIGGIDSNIAKFSGSNADQIQKLSAAFNDFKLALDNFDNPATHAALKLITGFVQDLTKIINFLNNPFEKGDTFRLKTSGSSGSSLADILRGSASKAKPEENHVHHIYLNGNRIATALSKSSPGLVEHGQGNNSPMIPSSNLVPTGFYGSLG